MEILLQNRLDFYHFLLPRLPDKMLRSQLSGVAGASLAPVESPLLRLENIEMYKLMVVDAFKKPKFGERWGKTTVSIQEAVERAIEFEEWIILATINSNDPGSTQLHEISARRLAELREMEDSLRYHRLRLVKTG